jgi:hypothetical protein
MRFTIRDLLLVMVIVALAIGWWVDHRRLAPAAVLWESRASALAQHMENEGVKVTWTESSTVVGESPGGGAGKTVYRNRLGPLGRP